MTSNWTIQLGIRHFSKVNLELYSNFSERNQKYEFIGNSLNLGLAKLITKTYLIEIKTADEMMAGTDANVTLCISGTKGDTGTVTSKSRTKRYL